MPIQVWDYRKNLAIVREADGPAQVRAVGKVVKDANGKTLLVKTRVKIAQSGAPQAPVAGPRAGEKRSTSADAEGRKTETVEVKPSVPPAH